MLPLVSILAITSLHIVTVFASLVAFVIALPRFAAGILVWLGVALYVLAYGGMVGFAAAIRHRHWDEYVELREEEQGGSLRMAWVVTLLSNDAGDMFRVEETKGHSRVLITDPVWRLPSKQHLAELSTPQGS